MKEVMMKTSETLIQEICEKFVIDEIDEAHTLSLLVELSDPTLAIESVDISHIYQENFVYGELYLQNHLIFGHQVLLGVSHCSIAIQAFKTQYPAITLTGIQRFKFIEPIVVAKDETAEISVVIIENDSLFNFEIKYRMLKSGLSGQVASGEYITHRTTLESFIDIEQLKSVAHQKLLPKDIYNADKTVLHLEDLFTVRELFVSSQGNLAQLAITDKIRRATTAYFLHPALLDGACVTAISGNSNTKNEPYVPFFIKEINIAPLAVPYECYCLTQITKITEDMLSCDMQFCNFEGRVFAAINGITFKKVDQINFFKNTVANAALENNTTHVNLIKKQEAGMSNSNINKLIESYFKNKLAQQLSISAGEVNIEANLMNLGLDSVQIMNLSREVEAEINIELYPTVFFEYTNVAELVGYFANEYSTNFKAYFDKVNPVVASNIIKELTPHSVPLMQTQDQQPLEVSIPVAQHNNNLVSSKENQDHDIAIIGMAGLFPQSDTLEDFYENLSNQLNFIEEVPSSRWDYKLWFDPNGNFNNKTYGKWGGFINDADKFDAEFFNISEKEAKGMDPQIRLLLQVLYAAADDAGYGSTIRGSSTGVYVGSSFQDYGCVLADDNIPFSGYEVIGISNTMVANRASFYFNLLGPSLMLDTSCSSSLVGLHLACQALRNGDCEKAFVAGVNLILSPRHYLMLCAIGALSPTGGCHTFDESADGYVPSEAIAAVLLKPLKKALADGDQIHAIIKGSAVNHSGASSAVTVPSVSGETETMLKAWQDANINPRTLSYIEAHGTGTKLGDPIEIQAIKAAMGQHTSEKGFCAIGSLKAHMGHTEAASGVSSLIKVILDMKNQRLLPMPNFKKLNPFINLDDSPVYINNSTQEWKNKNNQPRRAGINSFGFGGTYAHVVLEEFIENSSSISKLNSQPTLMQKFILLSAKNAIALDQYAANLKAYVLKKLPTLHNSEESNRLLKNIAYTLQVGRENMHQRLILIVDSIEDLIEKLDSFLRKRENLDTILMGSQSQEKLNLIFTGRAGQLYFQALLQEQDLSSLARLWLWGAQIDWKLLYTSHTLPEKISLPSYPFAKKRYWHDASDKIRVSIKDKDVIQEKFQDEPTDNKNISEYNIIKNPKSYISNIKDNAQLTKKSKKINEKSIKNWLYEELNKLTGAMQDKISHESAFEELGLTSIDMIQLYRNLGEFIGCKVPPGAFQEARTINSLVKYSLVIVGK